MNLPLHNQEASQNPEDEDNEDYDEEYDDEDEEESSDEEQTWPKYTPEEIAAMFVDFYRFLATLHYDVADLKVAPPGGWVHLTHEFCAGAKKTDFALEVMRALPYFTRPPSGPAVSFHHKSFLIDYSVMSKQDFDNWDEFQETYYNEGENNDVDAEHVFAFTDGHESAGRMHFLNTRHGEVVDEQLRCNSIGSFDIQGFFDDLKEQYRSLQLVPCLGRITFDADRVPEYEGTIAREAVFSETEKWFGTDLDIQYVRQVLRKHGWPEAFQKEEAKTEIDVLMEEVEEKGREVWDTIVEGW